MFLTHREACQKGGKKSYLIRRQTKDAASHSDGRELSIDPQAIRQPTLTARSAGHAIDRSHQLEAASNLFAIRSAEVSHHAPAVMRDVLELRTHVVQTLLMPDRAL